MFVRARRRLTVLYIVLFALVLALFSVAFYVVLARILAPTFDIGSEVTNQRAAEIAYQATIGQIGVALLIANAVVLVIVGVAAWLLAARTLDPIREAHLRQRRFVADASHEMRSPIAAIRSSAEVALGGTSTDADLRRALSDVVTTAERLTALTADLLVLAQARETNPDLRLEPFDLAVMVAETVDAEQAGRAKDPRRPALELTPDIIVRGDPDEVGRAVLNLIDNAFRYGGQAVRVRVRGSEREATVEVIDDGPGIAAAELGHVFDPFYRVRADAEAPQGSGLGLAIAASLATRNGGRITAESRPGAGSVFRLVLRRFR